MDPQEHKAFPPLQTSKKIREGKKKKKATIKNLFSLILMAKSPAEESRQAASISTQMGTGFWKEGLIQRAGWSLGGVISKMEFHCFQFKYPFYLFLIISSIDKVFIAS